MFLRMIDLIKHYGKITALDGFMLSVEEGETVVIMGPSGCGKSTSVRCINRLVEPDHGRILLQDQSVLEMNRRDLLALRKRIGYVFQGFNLVARFNVLENVMFGLVMDGKDAKLARDRAMLALSRVGMDESWQQKPAELSGGQQQRVGIARALAMEPELMLWDEPTASLDPILVREVLDVMEELIATSKTTMVIVTHEVSFARRVADRIVLMDNGRVVETGAPDVIFANPKSDIGQKYKHLLIS